MTLRLARFQQLQKELLATYGTEQPKAPVLSAKNITQTSVVLEWEPIEIAKASIKKLVLLRDGVWCGHIPNPLVRTATKLSGFGVEKQYTFQLVLYTTAGTYESNVLEIETHSMTDLRGITVCMGEIDPNMTSVTESEITECLEDIHAKPLQAEVKLDTTHFVCTKAQGAQWEKAVDMNIPVVLPEWIRACKMDKKMVNVRNFYLDSDPKHRSQYKRAPGAPESPVVNQGEFKSEPAPDTAPAPAETAPAESPVESPVESPAESTPAPAPAPSKPSLDRSNTRHSIFTEGATEAEEVAEDPLNVQVEKEVAAKDAEAMAEVDLASPSGEPEADTVEEVEEVVVPVSDPVPEPEVEAEKKAEEEVKEPEEAVTTDAVEPVDVETEEKAKPKTEPEPAVIDLTGDDKPAEKTEPETEKTEPESETKSETKPEPDTVKSPSQLAEEFAEVSLDDSTKAEDGTPDENKDDEDGDDDEGEDSKQEDSRPTSASSTGKKNKKKNKKKGKK
ncbi:Chitin biosynthesis protein [Yarrowia sp. C11]|nr:Chitin biosynthesis protein [Yarrowia sp. C11]